LSDGLPPSKNRKTQLADKHPVAANRNLEREFFQKVNAFFQKVNAIFSKVNAFIGAVFCLNNEFYELNELRSNVGLWRFVVMVSWCC
jgi:hypothetical protein